MRPVRRSSAHVHPRTRCRAGSGGSAWKPQPRRDDGPGQRKRNALVLGSSCWGSSNRAHLEELAHTGDEHVQDPELELLLVLAERLGQRRHSAPQGRCARAVQRHWGAHAHGPVATLR